MRSILLQICPVAIWCIVAGEVLLAALLFAHAARKRSKIALLSGILTLGLVIDAAIIGLGSVLKPDTLAAISPIRFIAHGLLIPLLFPLFILGWHTRLPLAKQYRAKKVCLRAPGMTINIDGRLERMDEGHYEICPGALRMMRPA